MTLIPLDIPPGVHSNGTDLESAGRWRSASLVRWRDGSLRPVGGWQLRKQDAVAGVARGAWSWRTNSGDRWVALGSASALWVVSGSNTATDITPGTLTSGNVDATLNTGFGGGFYGSGFYGTPRTDSGTYADATTWALDNFGQNLVACNPTDGKIWEWTLNTANDAVVVTNAPTGNLSILVTEERFLFALGADSNPRLVQWCDREDNTTWTAAATNEAGQQELQTSGQIMAGIRTRGQSLILTDIDAHTATYIGPPFVYGFERVGTSCGLVARKAVAASDAGVFWMGRNDFYAFNGASVQSIPCDVHDYVFGDINRTQISKAWAMTVGQQGEIWWFYPSASSSEVDRYVAFDYKEGHWLVGELARTTGVDRGVFTYPLMTDTGGELYEHEVGVNYDGATVFAESGPIAIGVGDALMHVNELIPDEKTQGDVTATFKTRYYPQGDETSFGPYTMANPTSVRFNGRQIRMRVTGNTASDWRVGTMRLDARAGGRR